MIETPDTTTPSKENLILKEHDIQISNLRFIAGNNTYPMAGVTSVKFEAIQAELFAPVILLLISILCFMIGGPKSIFFWVFVGGTIALVISRTGKYAITLGTAGGEVQSYVSRDRQFIQKIVKALNDAIVLRG